MRGPTGFVMRIQVLTPTVLITAFALSAVVVLALLARRTPRWIILATSALLAGAATGALTLWII